MTMSIPSALTDPPARSLRLAAAAVALGLVAGCAGTPPPPAPPAAQPVTVVVARGDTLLGIARQNGVTLQALAAANGLAPPYRIHPGQALHIPGAPPPLPVPQAPATGSALAAIGTAISPPVPTGSSSDRPPGTVTAEALPPPAPPEAAPAGPVPSRAALPAPPPEPPAAAAGPAPRASPAPASRRLPPGRFAWPVRGQVVSGFGAKGGGLVNDGMNIAAPRGTPVRAAADGTVIYAGNEVRGFGNLVLIRHEGGWVTAYGHAERVLVRQGQAVRAGEEIARVGSSGAVTTPQLHFQVRRDGRPVDPALHLERAVANRAS